MAATPRYTFENGWISVMMRAARNFQKLVPTRANTIVVSAIQMAGVSTTKVMINMSTHNVTEEGSVSP